MQYNTYNIHVPPAVSQEVPEVPVVNRASGHIYERKLVEKFIQENGKDPVTAAECTVDDLLEVKSMFSASWCLLSATLVA